MHDYMIIVPNIFVMKNNYISEIIKWTIYSLSYINKMLYLNYKQFYYIISNLKEIYFLKICIIIKTVF